MQMVVVTPVSVTSVWHQSAAQMMTAQLANTVMMGCAPGSALTVIIVPMEAVMPSVIFLHTLSVNIVTQTPTFVNKVVKLIQIALETIQSVAQTIDVAAHPHLTVREVMVPSVMYLDILLALIVTLAMDNVSLDVMKILTVLLNSHLVTPPAILADALIAPSAQEVMLCVM